MKRLLSVLITVAIIICQLSVVSSALNDETTNMSLDKFTSSFVEMLNSSAELDSLSGEADKKFSNSQTAEQTQANDDAETIEHSNRLVVKSTEKLDALDSVGYVYGYNDLHILQFDNRESFQKAYSYYSTLSCVEYVEEDMYLTEAVVDEGVVIESVADYPTGVQSNLFGYSNAKSGSGGNSVDIAVIDSGVQHDHDFLKGRVVDSGFNAVSDNGTAYDDRGHGTHVAGIIVANTLSNVTVHAYKALSAAGSGSASQISLAIDAAIEDGVDIINLSMQMKGTSSVLYEAVLKAYNAGICVIVAAGNSGVDLATNPYSPGGFTEAISVMSCSNSRKILSTSNYGTPCDFAAPGENILSTYINNTYKISTGTSMAAPFICAAAAYELADDNTLSPDEVCSLLSTKTEWCYGSPTGKCVYPATKVTVSGTTETPAFELDSCGFLGQMKVSLSCSTANADIFYSVNGAETFTEYTGPFYITETTSFSAFAVANGQYNSSTASVTYTLIDGDASDFTVDENDTLIAYNGSAVSVNVPSYVNGNRVLNVSSSAFGNNDNITSVVFESSLTNVGENAFNDCDNLLYVTAPGVINIDKNAFNNCDKLSAFTSNNLQIIGEGAFKDCPLIATLKHTNVTSVGANAFENAVNFTSFSSDYITEIGNEAFKNSGITSLGISNASVIGEYAFSGCTGLTSIILTNAVSIGAGAFQNCSAITTASLSALTEISEYCFSGCKKLSTVDADLVETINSYAFENCSLLKKFTFPAAVSVKSYAFESAGLTSVSSSVLCYPERYAFNNCKSLTTMTLSKPAEVDMSAFEGCVNITIFSFANATSLIIPEGGLNELYPSLYKFNAPYVTELPDNAFDCCSNLTEHTLTNLKSVGKNAFRGTALEELSFSSLTSAGEGAFSYMTKLKTVSLPVLRTMTADMFINDTNVTSASFDKLEEFPSDISVSEMFPNIKSFGADEVEEIPARMFSGCSMLTTVSFDNLYVIGEEAFKNCALTEIYLYADTIGENAFDGNPATSVTFDYLESLDCDIFGSSAQTITVFRAKALTDFSGYSLSSLPNLETVKLDALEAIPDNCFKGCSKLSSVSLASALTVGDNAFYGCEALSEISLDNVTTIGANAFYNCKAITYFLADSVETIDSSIFDGCDKLSYVCMNSIKKLPEASGESVFGKMESLSEFYADSVTSIPANAFNGCTSLEIASFRNATKIGDFAFKGTALSDYTFGNLTYIGNYAFQGTSVESFTSETVKNMGSGAFADCSALSTVSFSGLSAVSDYAFSNCTSLTKATFGELSSIGNNAFEECSLLASISYDKRPVEIGNKAFYNCAKLNVLYYVTPATLGSYALYGTKTSRTSGVYEIPELIYISGNAFDGVTIGTLILENVEEIYDVPEDSIVLVGTDVKAGAIPSDTTATIYSPAGSVASQYCIANGMNYFEFNETNPIITNTATSNIGYSNQFNFEALGFNLEYSWYGCNNPDGSDAVLLKSGSSFTPFPEGGTFACDEDDYKYFYCIAESYENGNIVNIKSNLIRNTFTYVVSKNNKNEVLYSNDTGYVFSTEQSIDDVLENIYLEEGACEITPSYTQGKYNFYGTGTSVDVYVDGELAYNYILILDGDVNGDGYVDVLDCSVMANASNGLTTITDENYYMAAAYFDGSYGVSAEDYQAVVNKAIS